MGTELPQPPLRQWLGGALLLYLLWCLATYALEGSQHTLLRPEAVGLRLVYTLVANMFIGGVAVLYVLRRAVVSGLTTAHELGAFDLRRSSVSVPAALALGVALLWVSHPKSTEPMVLINAYAQVLVVSSAEVLVCWVLLGSVVRRALGNHWPARVAAWLASSALFGVYHFAHSPPFDTWKMVLLLSVVGLSTGIFYALARDWYGALVFHNFLGIQGVIEALHRADKLASFRTPQLPLLLTAACAVALVYALDRRWLSGARVARESSSR